MKINYTTEIMEHDGEEHIAHANTLEGARIIAKGTRVAIIKNIVGEIVEEHRDY